MSNCINSSCLYGKVAFELLKAVLGINCGSPAGLDESSFDYEVPPNVGTNADGDKAKGADTSDDAEKVGIDSKTEDVAKMEDGEDANVPESANMECSFYAESVNGMSYATLISSESPVQSTANGWNGLFKSELDINRKYNIEFDTAQETVSIESSSGGDTIFPMTWADEDKNPTPIEADASNEIFVTMQGGLNILVNKNIKGVVSIGEDDWPNIEEDYLDINYLEFECY